MPKAYLDGTCVWKNYYPAILYSKVLQREHLDLYINERIGEKSEMARHKLAHLSTERHIVFCDYLLMIECKLSKETSYFLHNHD